MAENNKTIADYGVGTRFGTDNQPSGRGRKKRSEIVNELVAELGEPLSLEDARKIARIVWSSTAFDVNSLGVKQEQLPIIMNFFNKIINGSIRDKMWLIEWAFGKPKQDVGLEFSKPVVILRDSEVDAIDKLSK